LASGTLAPPGPGCCGAYSVSRDQEERGRNRKRNCMKGRGGRGEMTKYREVDG